MSLQPHPDTPHNVSLLIHRPNQDAIALTTSRLEQWFASAAASIPGVASKDTKSLATEFLGYYGLKNTAQVIQFLKSPAGESVLTMIGEQLAEVAAINEQRQHDLLQRYLLEKRVLAFLLMGLLERSEAHIHKLNEQAQEIAEQIRTGDKSGQGAKDAKAQEALNTLEALKQTEKALQEQLESTLKESTVLEEAIEAVRQDMERVEQKYAIYNTQVERAYEEMKAIPLVTASIQTIQNQINALTQQLEQDARDIDRFLDAGQDAMVRDRINRTNAVNLSLGILQDMLAVINGQKVLYTATGELTTDFHKANFIVPLKKQLVVANDKCYLLNAGQDLTTLSPEEMDRGEAAYRKMRPELMGVRELIQHNQSLEKEEIAGRQKTLAVRSDRMQSQIAFLARSIVQNQANQAALNASLTPDTNSNAPRPAPTPAPSPSLRAPAPTPSLRAAQTLNASYQSMLRLMGTTPTSREAIHRLQNDMSHLPLSPEMRTQLNTLRPGQPIPSHLMEGLMARTDLASVWDPISGSTEAATSSPTAPSPFSMRPSNRPK